MNIGVRPGCFRMALVLIAGAATGAAPGCKSHGSQVLAIGGRAMRGYSVSTGGSAAHGRQDIKKFQCGKCHTIPGVAGARGVFGPPLNAIARRTYLAGQIPNTPRNLASWIRAPQSMKPRTSMPELGLSEQDAQDVTAYLYRLR